MGRGDDACPITRSFSDIVCESATACTTVNAGQLTAFHLCRFERAEITIQLYLTTFFNLF
jgi:hypothetical protein